MISISSAAKVERWRATLLALALVGGIASCAKRDDQSASPRADAMPSGVVDQSLYAFLSKARAAHHEADLDETSGDRAKAVESVRKITQGARPKSSPEVIEVLADAHARIADLLSQGGDFEGAMQEVTKGLALAVTPTHFRGHLYEVQGIVEERHATQLRGAGDDTNADLAKERAIKAYQMAIEIQDIVIDRALSATEAPGGAAASASSKPKTMIPEKPAPASSQSPR